MYLRRIDLSLSPEQYNLWQTTPKSERGPLHEAWWSEFEATVLATLKAGLLHLPPGGDIEVFLWDPESDHDLDNGTMTFDDLPADSAPSC